MLPFDAHQMVALIGRAHRPPRTPEADSPPDQFDPDFFGMSPEEAAQAPGGLKLLLELAWEALEDAGIIPAELRDLGVAVLACAPEPDPAIADGLRAVLGLREPGDGEPELALLGWTDAAAAEGGLVVVKPRVEAAAGGNPGYGLITEDTLAAADGLAELVRTLLKAFRRDRR